VIDHEFNLPVCPNLSHDGKGGVVETMVFNDLDYLMWAYDKVIFKSSKKELANILEKMLKLNFWH
jgi:hypothetical protein